MKTLIVVLALLIATLVYAEDHVFTDDSDFIFQPSTRISFGTTEESYIDWSSGKLAFHGNAEKSAEIFFKCFIKPLVDEYIREKLKSNYSPKNRSYL